MKSCVAEDAVSDFWQWQTNEVANDVSGRETLSHLTTGTMSTQRDYSD